MISLYDIIMRKENIEINKSKKEIENAISSYTKNGYAMLGPIVSKSFVKKLNKRVEDLMAGRKKYKNMFFKLDDPKGNYWNIEHEDVKNEFFSIPSNRYKKIKDLEYDPLFLRCHKVKIIREFAKKFIGKNVSSMRAMLANKNTTNSSIFPWHQDVGTKWNMSGPPTFTIWLSINGSNKKKGCVKIIEDSHKTLIGDGNILSKAMIKKWVNKKKLKHVELKAGEAVIFSNYLVHGSDKNKTKKNRLGFAMCLMDAKIKNLKTNKTYPKIFGKNALTPSYVKKLKKIPDKVYQN